MKRQLRFQRKLCLKNAAAAVLQAQGHGYVYQQRQAAAAPAGQFLPLRRASHGGVQHGEGRLRIPGQ